MASTYSTRALARRSKLFKSSIGSTSRGRSAANAANPFEVLVVGEVAGADGFFVDADLCVAGVCTSVGFGDVGPHAVQDLDLLELGDLEPGVRHADQGDVADAQVLNRPVHDRVEVGTAAQSAEDRSDQVAAAAEAHRR